MFVQVKYENKKTLCLFVCFLVGGLYCPVTMDSSFTMRIPINQPVSIVSWNEGCFCTAQVTRSSSTSKSRKRVSNNFFFRNSATSLKSNIDIQNSHVWKEIHFPNHHFFLCILDSRGVMVIWLVVGIRIRYPQAPSNCFPFIRECQESKRGPKPAISQ